MDARPAVCGKVLAPNGTLRHIKQKKNKNIRNYENIPNLSFIPLFYDLYYIVALLRSLGQTLAQTKLPTLARRQEMLSRQVTMILYLCANPGDGGDLH